MNRSTKFALVAVAAALLAALWHATETDTACRDKGGLLLRDLTGFVCVQNVQRVAP